MSIGNGLAVEGRTKVLESFYFLSGKWGSVNERKACKTGVKEGKDLDVVGWGDGGHELLSGCNCRWAKMTSR